MMSLQVQSMTLFASFLYGIFFEVTLYFCSKLIYNKNYVLKVIFTFVFVMVHIILYFLILERINYGIVHIYAVLSLLLGYIVGYYLNKWFAFHLRK